MSNSAEESEIFKQVLAYSETGTTHMEPDVLRNPVSRYTDPERLRLEVQTLFRKFPIIVGHSSKLAEAGQYFTHDATGVPILVTRSRAGAVKAFLNVCRHRGARVATEPCGSANTLSCPYHGWTYDLDGRLRGMRQPVGFDDLDKSTHGLIELPAFERFGLIWIRPSASTTNVDIDGWLAPLATQLQSLDLASHCLFREWSIPRNMHWRIALEGFQESYHFCSAHKETACSSYLDNQTVFVDHYPHVRHAVPLARITKQQGTAPQSWDYRSHFMDQNYVFPCNFVQVMTDHVYVHTILPTGPDSCVFQCQMLIPEAAETDKARKYWEANYNVVRTVFDEDFAIGEGIQQGLEAGANTHFTIGRFESGIQLCEKAIGDALEGKLRA
ncbi:MAG: aromatic ring-hydroxylating dioxygenase subunit alpha [Pseudomonadales bacterium]